MGSIKKYNIIKKLLIPTLVLAIFLLPISPSFEIHSDNLSITKNIVSAGLFDSKYLDDFTAKTTVSDITRGSVHVAITLTSKRDNAFTDYSYTNWALNGPNDKSGFDVSLSENNQQFSDGQTLTPTWGDLGWTRVSPAHFELPNDTVGRNITLKATFTDLKPNTKYYVGVRMVKDLFNNYEVLSGSVTSFVTLAEGQGPNPDTTSSISSTNDFNFGCSLINGWDGILGCIASLFYFVWTVTALVAHVAGLFLDFFIYYSTNSGSYTSGFIDKGWGAMRDIANIFFIIALLYIAIKTILGLGAHNKKIIGYVIIFALLINFSLFTTHVVIDSSNILAKIFYNATSAKDANGHILTEKGGQRSISVSLVDKYNPQVILGEKEYNENRGTFIFIIICLIAVTLYTAYIFFSVALLFVSRVVSLWIAMIFSPIAFASYTLPFNIPGMGYKEWWKNLFENAFLAPLFIFMLYLVVMFAGFLKEIINVPPGSDTMTTVMGVIIPFILLVGLLQKSKQLAVKYSGEMGKMILSAGKMVGGFVAGAAMGGAGLIGRGTIGAGASFLLRSKAGEDLKTAAEKKGLGGFAARIALRTTTAATKKSFDMRSSGAFVGLTKSATGFNLTAGTGALGMGKKEGGFQGTIDRRNKKALAELETHKTKMTNDEVKTWNEEKEKKDGSGLKNKDGSLITTAEGLNNYRIAKFNENLGKTGIVSSMAYSAVYAADKFAANNGGKTIKQQATEMYDKEHNYEEERDNYITQKNKERGGGAISNEQKAKDTAEFDEKYNKDKQEKVAVAEVKILDDKAKKVKMKIGVAIAATAGLAGGFAGAGMLGGWGAAAGAGLGAGSVAGEGIKQLESERLTRAAIGKQISALDTINKRLAILNETFAKQQAFLDRQKGLFSSAFTGEGKVNREEVDRLVAIKQTEKDDLIQQLRIINNTIKRKRLAGESVTSEVRTRTTLINKSAKTTVDIGGLNELKNIEDKISTTQQNIYNITKDKSGLSTPSTPSTPATSNKH